MNVEVDRCEVNEDDQDCEDDRNDEDGDDESDRDGDVRANGHVPSFLTINQLLKNEQGRAREISLYGCAKL